jgi:hypothetical protein
MFLESLIKLAEIVDHYKSNNEILINEEFHNETEELIKSQTDFLMNDLEFKKDNPGPYSFGFGNLELNIFSPDQTDIQEWAMIVRKDGEQMNYRFNSMLGFMKVLIMAINGQTDGDK